MGEGREHVAETLVRSRTAVQPASCITAQSTPVNYRAEIGPEAVVTSANTDDVQVATLAYGLGNWYLAGRGRIMIVQL